MNDWTPTDVAEACEEPDRRYENDYRSNITGPDLLPAFPNAEPFTIGGHLTHHDRDFDTHCGYLSPDEAAILYHVASAFRGLWCEVGSHTGWSGAHIAVAGCDLVALEPRLREVAFARRTYENWGRLSELGRQAGWITPMAMRSDEYFACGDTDLFDGAFVDGDHEPGMPLRDAAMLLPRMQERCTVVFHDFVGQPVQDAVTWLVQHKGFRFRVYNTAQMVAVCWRGDWHPPEHVPDPSRDWGALRAQHDFDYSGES